MIRSYIIRNTFSRITADIPSINRVSSTKVSINLVIGLNLDTMEVPIIDRMGIERVFIKKYILKTPIYKDLDTVVIPLSICDKTINSRTFDCIFKKLCDHISYRTGLLKFVSPKGHIYYMGNGIILDANLTPLLLFTLKGEYKKSTLSSPCFSYNKPIIYVDPIVFLRQDRFIEKNIVKKLIPLYITNPVHLPSGVLYVLSDNEAINKVSILIENIGDKFFIKSTTPSCKDDINESINQCLVDYTDELIYNIKNDNNLFS